jgi:hypothetical protein
MRIRWWMEQMLDRIFSICASIAFSSLYYFDWGKLRIVKPVRIVKPFNIEILTQTSGKRERKKNNLRRQSVLMALIFSYSVFCLYYLLLGSPCNPSDFLYHSSLVHNWRWEKKNTSEQKKRWNGINPTLSPNRSKETRFHQTWTLYPNACENMVISHGGFRQASPVATGVCKLDRHVTHFTMD